LKRKHGTPRLHFDRHLQIFFNKLAFLSLQRASKNSVLAASSQDLLGLTSTTLIKCKKDNNKTRSTLDLVRALLNLLLILVVLPHLLDEVVLVDPMELWLLLLVLQLEDSREGCRGSVAGLSEGWGCCSWNGLIFSLLVCRVYHYNVNISLFYIFFGGGGGYS
jgi:hypothetical protein